MYFVGIRIEIKSKLKRPEMKKISNEFNLLDIEPVIKNYTINAVNMNYEKKQGMLILKPEETKGPSSLISFSMAKKIKKVGDAKRLVKIINILGNDRIIREPVSVFAKKQSMLNDLPELECFLEGFDEIKRFFPKIIKSGHYYAPELFL